MKPLFQSYRNEAGFSLLEIVISIAFFLLLAMAGTAAFTPWTNFKMTYDTDERLSVLKSATRSMYSTSAWYLDDTPGLPVPYLNPSREKQDGVSALQSVCDPTDADNHDAEIRQRLAGLAAYTGRDSNSVLIDGHRRPFCFFISDRFSRNIDGVRIYYHNVGILSKGNNGSQQMLWDPATGSFYLDVASTSDNDDRYFIVSGWDIQLDNYREVTNRMDRIVRAYQTYFSSRYKFDQSPSAMYNYFHQDGCPAGHNGSVQSGGSCPYSRAPSITAPTSMNTSNPQMETLINEIGISPVDTGMPWVLSVNEANPLLLAGATNLLLQNDCPAGSTPATCSIRSSNNGFVPPYTAFIGGIMPGGSTVSRLAIGVY